LEKTYKDLREKLYNYIGLEFVPLKDWKEGDIKAHIQLSTNGKIVE
jgi:hypothetical protein